MSERTEGFQRLLSTEDSRTQSERTDGFHRLLSTEAALTQSEHAGEVKDGTMSANRKSRPTDEARILHVEGVHKLSKEVVRETPAPRATVKGDIVTSSETRAAASQFADRLKANLDEFATHGL